jgi:hypothetical protein
MKITKKQIAEQLKSKEVTKTRTYYEFSNADVKYSVNTFKFSIEREQITDETGHGHGFCDTKQDFIDFLYRVLNK